MNAYWGKLLRVNLTERTVEDYLLDEKDLRMYMGGSGLGAKILYDKKIYDVEPLSPENILLFLTGPLVGTAAPNFGRYQVVTKSPLTGGIGEANSGGTWGPALRKAGYDGIMLEGSSEIPVYIYIDNGRVEIRDASHLWGMDTIEVDEALKNEIDNKVVTCSIGQAGEKLSRIASIMNDGVEGRAAGRCGVGAVMGSKKVKAIAVKGSMRPPLYNQEAFMGHIKEKAKSMAEKTEGLRDFGTAVGLTTGEAIGDLPIKNWSAGNFENAEKLSGQTLAKTLLKKKYHCAQCVIGCGRTIDLTKSKYKGIVGGGPEYETTAMFGSNCMIDDLEAISKANELCNRYGMDTISTGAAVSFAMEAYEKGILTKDDLGMELNWGDADAMIKMVEKIGLREAGIGYLLGEGTKRAADEIGGIAPELTAHVKGLELPAHDARAAAGSALQYAVSTRGACHLNSFTHDAEFGFNMKELDWDGTIDRFSEEDKSAFVARMQNFQALCDSLNCCKFIIFGLEDESIQTIIKWLNYATGWDVDKEEFLRAGERIVTIKKMFNIKCGFTRNDDTLPNKMLKQTRGTGGAADYLPHLGRLLSKYYEVRNYDELGIPTDKLLKKLELQW